MNAPASLSAVTLSPGPRETNKGHLEPAYISFTFEAQEEIHSRHNFDIGV